MAYPSEEITVRLRLLLRPLASDDLQKDFIPLLEQLSTIGHFSEEFFHQRLEQVVDGDDIVMMVVEDTALHRIVGFGTVIIEPKFIHQSGKVGHIEDVVVDHALRRKGLGTQLVQCLTAVAKSKGCYKVIVDCSPDNAAFYSSCQFVSKGACMTRYFERRHQTRIESQSPTKIKPSIHRERFIFRRLEQADYNKGYLELLAQLTTVGTLRQAQFEQRLAEANATGNHHLIVVQDSDSQRIVAAGTLFLEQKFIRSAGIAGHIEDVVVDSATRGQGLGKAIINYLRDLADQLACYKCILDCDDSNVGFYEKCGFSKGHSPVFMAQYFSK